MATKKVREKLYEVSLFADHCGSTKKNERYKIHTSNGVAFGTLYIPKIAARKPDIVRVILRNEIDINWY